MLTERRRIVLRAVVDHHFASAAPVGSGVLARRYLANVSPATIRSEMSALEHQSLVYQPHTSAGRLPTVAGYRRVVDDILAMPRLSVSGNVQGLSAAYPHKELHLALRQAASPRSSLLLAELFKSVVANLAAVTSGLALLTLTAPKGVGPRGSSNQLYYNGLANLLTQPEFSKPEAQAGFTKLVGMLEHETEMSEVLEMCSLDKRVIVSIGEESKASGLNEISMVTARYKGGTVAIIGPLRMNYREAISAVSTAAHTLDDILE